MRVAHASGMPGTFSPPPTSKESASHRSQHASRYVRDARTVIHAGIAYPRCRGKRSLHSRRMCNRQFYVSGKGPMIHWIKQDKTELSTQVKIVMDLVFYWYVNLAASLFSHIYSNCYILGHHTYQLTVCVFDIFKDTQQMF